MKGILAALWRYLVPFLLVTSMAAAACGTSQTRCG
jgi:hypothetical protein